LSAGRANDTLARAKPSDSAAPTAAALRRATDCLRQLCAAPWPRLVLVLGSGLSEAVDGIRIDASVDYADIPGFPLPGVAGHAGKLSVGELAGVRIVVLQGREHYYEHGRADAMAVPIRALRALGCEQLLMTNAVGSADPLLGPGSLVLISDHINLTGANPLIGGIGGADCFVDMTNAYDPQLRARLHACAEAEQIPLNERVYACFSGPSFETPAEIRAARILGADTVGMSVAPETILARQCGLQVAAISVVTNFAAGVACEPLSHAQTMATAAGAAPECARLIRAYLTTLQE